MTRFSAASLSAASSRLVPRHRARSIVLFSAAVVFISALISLGAAECAVAAPLAQPAESSPLETLEAALPQTPRQCTAERAELLAKLAMEIERRAAERAWADGFERPQVVLDSLRAMVTAKDRVDAALEATIMLRTSFAELPADAARQEHLRQYLEITSTMIDLSGRLRYLLRDGIDNGSYVLDEHPAEFTAMLDSLIEHRVEIGAAVMSYVLFDPPPESGALPFPPSVKQKAMRLIEASRSTALLPALADLVRERRATPAMRLRAAQAIRRIGLPQAPRPGQDPTLPAPAITADDLHPVLQAIEPDALTEGEAAKRRELLDWLDTWRKQGVQGDSFQWGEVTVRPGDWLLMRNPSPYNRFTDLSPGLFTHVGIVAVEQGEDGVRRFVIVELPERGQHVPATNVDIYLQRTLHWFFLRHEDPTVQQEMGEIAAELIGHETQFDLTFRTSRVRELKGQALGDSPIHTYCAGFLLLCAQQTSAPSEQFFPIGESPAGGHCLANLATLGLSIGQDFVSPTGAIFSPHLQLVGRREPMYEPGREVKEAIYDHFAWCMIHKRLTPAPDLLQSLREQIAGLSKRSPWMARALARVNNVSEHMDLESAARAAAVVETLDEIANGSMQGFYEARAALLAGPLEQLSEDEVDRTQLAQIRKYRQRHSDLFQRWSQRRISPRQLRMELVDYYASRGRQRLEQRFFAAAEGGGGEGRVAGSHEK